MRILGVRVDNFSKEDILEKIEFFLSEKKFHQIATVNPEFILQAQADAEFGKILNESALNVADGVGLWYAFLRWGKILKGRFAGADLMLEVLKMAENKGLGVFLAINKNGLSNFQEIRISLLEKNPKLNINGADLDPQITNYQLPVTSYEVLFCNFGAPAQEKFINSQKNDIIRLAMGVGGSFDFLTGKLRRAPLWMQKSGLEWLFRLAIEPTYRVKRIFRAVIIFPLKVLFNNKCL